MNAFLRSTAIIDWDHPAVRAQADALAKGSATAAETARRAFTFVRDQIRHSHDFGLQRVTCSASEVLEERAGYCYAKSHLLAALLRANRLPAGLCYQRLSLDGRGAPYCLHGFNAVWLPDVGWYRMDPRGNRADVNAQFVPPAEQLAFTTAISGEMDFPEIWADPLPLVVEALKGHATAEELQRDLPDVELRTVAGERL